MWPLGVSAIVLFAVVGTAFFRAGGDGPAWVRVSYWLRVAAAAFTVVVALVIVGPAWADSGSFALMLVGVPLLLAAAPFTVTSTTRLSTALVWAAALLMLGWALLMGLGSGWFFAGPAIVMLAAALASTLGKQSSVEQHTRSS